MKTQPLVPALCMLIMILGMNASIFTGMAIGKPSGGSQWDEDGGFTGDYSHIPRLQWMGPGKPDTYEEYCLKKGKAPFHTKLAFSSGSGKGENRISKALVLVNTNLYSGIQERLDTYMADLEDDGYSVEAYLISGGTPQDLKAFIVTNSDNLAGCVFVGDLPIAWYELEVWGHEEFPCDLYYMDLDGSWIDNDSDGKWDEHSSGSGDEGPEIFIGHIDASMMTGSEAATTNDYLDKNHAYRTGQFIGPDYALSYTEDDWAMHMDIRTDIKYAYPDFDDIPAPDTNRDDYVYNRVPNPDYEFIQLCCHSSPFAHYFTRGGLAYNYQIKAATPHAMFYNLFCCSTLRYTETDFLGGSYIYDTSETSIAVMGSTKTGSMLVFYAFYQPFGAYETFGESFRQWFNYIAPYNSDEQAWHFGMTIVGDPFLQKTDPPLFIEFPEGLPEGRYPPGPKTRMTLEINTGLENYVPGTGMLHYRFDSNDPYSTAALTPLGGSLFEAMLPNTQPGDEPEFYFSAQGDGGTTVFSPPGAPGEVYSFDVCFVELFMEDDFETHKGWTVKNQNLETGEWERADPAGTEAQPEDDHTPNGTQCYVTGKLGGGISDDDVDGGPTRLISPTFDLADSDALISFYCYFYHSDYGIQKPLEIRVSNDNGTQWHPVMNLPHSPEWTFVSFKLSDYIAPTSQVKVRVSAHDNPDDDIVEALIDDFRAEYLVFDPSFWADAYSIPVAQGANINFSLDAGTSHSGRSYLLLGSMSGTEPGIILPGGVNLPLNWDLFTDFVMALINTSVFSNFLGTLDISGASSAQLNAPPVPGFAGMTLHFAYALNNPWDFVSNPIAVEIVP